MRSKKKASLRNCFGLKSTSQKWKKVPTSRAKNDRENSIFFRSRSQKKRLTIRSKSELAFRVERD